MANDYYTRQGSYTKGTLARGDVVKSDFDALVTAWDTGQTNIKRAIKLPDESTDFEFTENAAARASKAIGFDSSGDLELQTGVGSWEGTWATTTAYELRDVVVDGAAGASTDNLYVCIVAHTSGTWSTDLAAAKWELMVNVSEARDWARKTDGIVDSTDYSSKAWAVGGTDVTTTASRGAAKEWATSTGAAVDTSEFSAKEYAQGTQASTGGSAKDYAQKTDGGVSGATSDHSAKAWAVGGTGISDTASKGAAKEWSVETSGTVDGTSYSSKEYAQGTQASTGGSAKDFAQKTDGGVSGSTSDHSAKSWAVGGTGISTTASKGAAKEWAVASGLVDTASYSSKEYAQGTAASTGGSSKSWAQDADAVNGAGTDDRSAKAWAQGASMTGATLGGSSKDWAQTAEDSTVDGSEYSALHYSAKASASSTAASTAQTAAETAETNAETAQTAAETAQTAAETAETNAETAETNAETAQTAAETAQTAAETAETNASASATSASSSATSAAASATSAAASYDSFDDRYLGAFSSAPTLDNDGNSLTDGCLYFDNTIPALRVYDLSGTSWQTITVDTDVKVSVSSNDTTPGYLNGKLVEGANITFTETNDGGNETLLIAATDNSAAMALALGG